MPHKTSNSAAHGWPAFWLARGPQAALLWPLAKFFSAIATLRRASLTPQTLAAPVIVVGGITVGGAGKTPLTLALIDALGHKGFKPGVISRGYGGSATGITQVTADSHPASVGDEPVLIHLRSGCPVFVGADRVAAGAALLQAYPEVDVLVADDGLQHYRMARVCELAVIDQRGLGNGWTLPAGPLREPPTRLREVDAIILNQASYPAYAPPGCRSFSMQLQGERFVSLAGKAEATAGELLARQFSAKPLHAVAGIGSPQRFFDYLKSLGLDFEAHAFPDHHAYTQADLADIPGVILTTEKDAVKLRPVLGADREAWVLPVSAIIPDALVQLIVEKVHGRKAA